ncbi:MAG: hypothetical protein HW387_964 [Parachlamydiales bacterium]|nr:hypothetical protein [Parachlamydiales bacterium]
MHDICRFLVVVLLPFQLFSEISALYLSWYGDPSTTMAVQWHSDADLPQETLLWKELDQSDWHETASTHRTLPGTRLYVHAVNLSTLSPGAEYEFRISSDSPVYRFRTMPQTLDRPVSFVVGAEIFGSRKIFRKMAETIRQHDPDFIVIGGNMARAIHPNPVQVPSSALRHWLSFFNEWKKSFVAEQKRIIPFLVIPGSEDIRPDDYELFFSLFAFPEHQLYRSLDFGHYLTLYLLDSGHFHPIDGPQSYWLNRSLNEPQKNSFRFAVYSESAYPSSDPYLGGTAKKIRTHWCPLFERTGLHAAFEHHNYAFKRTFPLKEGHIANEGTVYLGDGCWGAEPRKTNDLWYLEKKAKRNGVWLVQLTPEKASLQAIDLFNETIDELALTNK